MTISQFPDPNGVAGTRVIFAVSDVRRPNTILAASSLSTQADVIIMDLSSGGVVPLANGEELVLDPQGVPPTNAFYAVKSVKLGRTTLYLFPCAITAAGDTCTGSTGAKSQVNNYLAQQGDSFVC
jgi:hypothetical protein